MATKSNIDHLRGIIKEFSVFDAAKGEEAEEFLDEVEKELTELIDEVSSQKQDILDLESELEDMEDPSFANESFVGLDTINWSLDKGNMKVEMQIEQFIEGLRKQNGCVPV